MNLKLKLLEAVFQKEIISVHTSTDEKICDMTIHVCASGNWKQNVYTKFGQNNN